MLCYTVTVLNLSAPLPRRTSTRAATRRGPVEIPLVVGSGTSFEISACTTPARPTLAGLLASPRGAYYVNVHTPTFPGGEVRGQLK